MYKKILLTLLLLLIPKKILADCTKEQISRYKSLSSNIESYYNFNGNSFDITLYNVSSEFHILNKKTNQSYYTNTNGISEINMYNMTQNQTLTLALYPNDYCPEYRIKTIYITLPSYNNYYNDPVCINNTNKLCSKWINTSMYTYEEFVKKVTVEKPNEEDQKQEEPTKENKYTFFDFLGDYYIYILLLIIVTGSYAIYKLDKKSKFDF